MNIFFRIKKREIFVFLQAKIKEMAFTFLIKH